MEAVRKPAGRARRSVWAAAVLMSMIAAMFAMPPAANAAALTNANWSVSNNQVSATPVTYSFSFTTATTGVIKSITLVFSGAGMAGTPAIARNYGIGAGSVALAGQTITYTVTAAVSVSAGMPIYIELSGLTNTATAGPYTFAVTTRTAAPATIDGPTNTNSVTMAANNTAITVAIAKSLTFTVNTTAFELDMDPSLPALADQSQAVGLTVQTNANSGYTLTVSDNASGLISAATGTPTIPKVSTGKATSVTWPGAPNWGYTVTATGATADAAFSGSKYAGYVAGGEVVATHGGPTGGVADTITITNRVAINYATPATTYTDTVTYTATPNYT